MIRFTVANCGISYCDKHETKKSGQTSWKDLVGYYYGSINDEEKIQNIEMKIKCASYFKEELGFNYEEYTGKLRTIIQQLTKIGVPLCPAEEVAYLISWIKASNNEIKMRNITFKTDITGMVIGF